MFIRNSKHKRTRWLRLINVHVIGLLFHKTAASLITRICSQAGPDLSNMAGDVAVRSSSQWGICVSVSVEKVYEPDATVILFPVLWEQRLKTCCCSPVYHLFLKCGNSRPTGWARLWPLVWRSEHLHLGRPVIRDGLLPAARHVVSCFNTDRLAAHHQPLGAFTDQFFQRWNILWSNGSWTSAPLNSPSL